MNSEELFKSCSDLVLGIMGLYPTWEGKKQFQGTPARLTRMYGDFCWPEARIAEELKKQFRTFENGYDEMLTKKDISVWTLCPHHLLPCHFSVSIGYLPTGKVLGLSKFSRIAEIMARRPIMQEAYSVELADTLMKELQPKGVGVYVVGTHGCISARGVRQNSEVVTSIMRGAFLKEAATRSEFLAVCLGR